MSINLSTIADLYHRLPKAIQNASRTALRTFLGAELVLVPVLLAAPNVHTQEQLFLAGTFAAGAAAIRLIEHAISAYFSK